MSRLKITIKNKEGEEGAVVYRPSSKSILVSHPDSATRNTVREYLATPRWLTEPIEDGNQFETHQREVTPTESLFTMYASLVEMGHQIGVSPVWNDIDNQLPETEHLDMNSDVSKGLYINLDRSEHP